MTVEHTPVAAAPYYPLVIWDRAGSMIVTVKDDGTPLFGDGVSQDNVWSKIAAALSRETK